jgi:transposase
MREHRHYDSEFKQEAVRLVLEEGRTFRGVASSLGISASSLKNWIRQHRQNGNNALCNPLAASSDSGVRIRELEKELERTRRERDILKKAMAIFTKEPDTLSRRMGS